MKRKRFRISTIVLGLFFLDLIVIPISQDLALPWRDPWWDERHPWSRCRSVPCRVRRPAPAPWSRTRSRETQPGSGPLRPRWSPSGISAPSPHNPGKILKLSKEEYDKFNPVFRIRIRTDCGRQDLGGQKLITKREKKWIYFKFISAGCSLLMAEGFSCSLDVLYGGQGISISQLSIKIIYRNYFQNEIFLKFWSSKYGIRNLICWICTRTKTNADPKHWFNHFKKVAFLT